MIQNTFKSDHDLELIVGHCSTDHSDASQTTEMYEMADITIPDGAGRMRKGITALRFVNDAKSRTKYVSGVSNMGPGSEELLKAMKGECIESLPGAVFAREFINETGMGLAAEIMLPHLQLPFYEGMIPKGQFIVWNPAVTQNGWIIAEMSMIAQRNDWHVGLKNPKWLGSEYKEVLDPCSEIITSMEAAWEGLASYALAGGANYSFIHRGVDIPEKGDYRNAILHELVRRVARRNPNVGRWFDPSHTHGPDMVHSIPEAFIAAMRMRVNPRDSTSPFLYDGGLIEVGTSKTDTKQHITIDALRYIVREVSRFRVLSGPLMPTN